MDWLPNLQSFLGLAVIVAIAIGLSEDRRALPSARWICGALSLQVAIALVALKIPLVWSAFAVANDAVLALQEATLQGSSFMFGYLGGAPAPFQLNPGAAPPVIIAFQILPLVIVTSALAALLWHLGVLQALIRAVSLLLRRTLHVGGVVGLNAAANVFMGVVEAPMVVRAYLERISRSELFAIMTLGMSTVSGVVLVLYSQVVAGVVDNAFGHMIAASLISLPAALLLARLLVPGDLATDEATRAGMLHYDGAVDALIRGTVDGLQLFLAIIAVLIMVFALVALADASLALLPAIDGTALSVRRIFGWLFAPAMWLAGVPWAEAGTAGALMGTKAILNEFVAYQDLAALAPGQLGERSRLITVYALCGFANLASIGLSLTTIGTLAPQRRAEASRLGFKAWLAGNLATLMTGAVVGLISR